METYSKECLEYFLNHQLQLFDEKIAMSHEEAREFLEDSMAVVVNTLAEVKEYFEESGMDTAGMTMEELNQAAEVFHLPDGKYLVVEG